MTLQDIFAEISKAETTLIPVVVPQDEQGLAALAFVGEQTLFNLILKFKKPATTTAAPAAAAAATVAATPAVTAAVEPADFIPAGVPSAHN
jgi:hypothetical protein